MTNQHKGRITKTGNRQVRRPEFLPLEAWAARLAARRGRRVAVVAVARKLAGILYAMMRDATTFDVDRWSQPQTSASEDILVPLMATTPRA